MGESSPTYKETMVHKQSKQTFNLKNTYLKPGALAQLHHNLAASRFCADKGRKRAFVIGSKKVQADALQTMALDKARILSFETFGFPPTVPDNRVTHKVLPGSPRTPQASEYISDSRLESLPLDILVKIICNLRHNQLRAVFHVSQKISKAVVLARQLYFNYNTPLQEMLNDKTSLETERWSLKRKLADGEGHPCRSPQTPKRPRLGPRLTSRFNESEMRQLATVLFQDPAIPAKSTLSPAPGLPIATIKALNSSRWLIYKNELRQAFAEDETKMTSPVSAFFVNDSPHIRSSNV